MEKPFTIKEAFKEGSQLFARRWLFWVGVSLFATCLLMTPQVAQMALPEDAYFASFILSLIHFVLGILVGMGLYTLALKAVKGEEYIFADFFASFHLFSSFLLAEVLYSLIVVVGLLLFIVPGVILGLKFALWPFYIIDRSETGLASLKSSDQATYGFKGDILLFWLSAILVNALGVLALGVGLLVTVPLTTIAWTYIYLKLSKTKEVTL